MTWPLAGRRPLVLMLVLLAGTVLGSGAMLVMMLSLTRSSLQMGEDMHRLNTSLFGDPPIAQTMQSSIDQLTPKFAELNHELGKLTDDTHYIRALPELNQRLARVEENTKPVIKLAAIDEQIRALRVNTRPIAALPALVHRLDALGVQLDTLPELRSDVRGVGGQLRGLGRSLDRVGTGVGGLRTQVGVLSRVSEDLGGLAGSVGSISESTSRGLSSVNSSVSELLRLLSQAEQHIESLDRKVPETTTAPPAPVAGSAVSP